MKQCLYKGKASLVYLATDNMSDDAVVLKLYRKSKLNTLNRYQVTLMKPRACGKLIRVCQNGMYRYRTNLSNSVVQVEREIQIHIQLKHKCIVTLVSFEEQCIGKCSDLLSKSSVG